MTLASFRPLFAAAALAMALAGALSVALFAGHQTPASAYNTYTIEVNEEGFNPRTCNINRGDAVVFKNAGNVDIRIYTPGFGGLPPRFDETLKPGETSLSPERFDAGGNYLYHSEFGDFVTITIPQWSNYGQVSCSKEAPTPTPTPTATPGPPPTPAPERPSRCTWVGCAVSLGLASDGH